MKKIYTLVLAVLVGAAAMAADNRPRTGMVTVSVKQNSAVRITVDGRNYSERDNDVSISNLAPGYHTIQVFAMSNSRTIFGRNREQLLWSNSLYVQAGTETDVTINRNGRAKVKEVNMPYSAGYGNGSWDNNDNRNDHGRDNNDHNDHGRDNGSYNNGGYNSNSGYGHRK